MARYTSQGIDRDGNSLRYMHQLLIFDVGDMQLTKSEIAETQVIVTTPEKWDVVTRKPTGEGELASVCLHISTCAFTCLTVFCM